MKGLLALIKHDPNFYYNISQAFKKIGEDKKAQEYLAKFEQLK